MKTKLAPQLICQKMNIVILIVINYYPLQITNFKPRIMTLMKTKTGTSTYLPENEYPNFYSQL